MKRIMYLVVKTLVVCGLVFAAGCEDPKQRIAQLEQANQELAQQTNSLRDQLAQCEQENSGCQSQLAAARGEAQSLRDQMASKPEPAALPEGWTAVPGGAMIAIEGSILFPEGKTTLRQESKSALERVASVLKKEYSDRDILVFGHTDSDPIRKSGFKDNLELSTERASAVVRQLQSRGISASRLVACGAGEHRPVAPNSTKDNKQKNRRVEIFALTHETRTALAKDTRGSLPND